MKPHEYYTRLALEAVQSNDARVLPRYNAAEMLSYTGFPAYKSESYQRTDPEAFLNDLLPVSTAAYTAIPKMAEGESRFYSGSLLRFFEQYPAIATQHYNQVAAPSADGFVHLNTAMLRDGYALYVPRAYKVPNPIKLSFEDGTLAQNVSLRRILIVMEEQAEATLIIDDEGCTEGAVAIQVCEISAAAGSTLHIYETEMSRRSAKRISSTHIDQYTHSSLAYSGLTLANGLSRNNYYANLSEPGAEIKLMGLSLALNGRHIDNFSCIRHNAPHCHTEEIFKYIVGDDAMGVFSGLIYVDQKAQQTTAYQSNRNLILSPSGKMYSKPQLEIYADDVKCSHGMTTGQLDEQALFYLRARGIPADQAKRMLTIAFADEVIRTIHLEEYRERLTSQIEAEL